MSYSEYYDLFENAQQNGNYFAVVFDGKNHRKNLKLPEYQKAREAYKNGQIDKQALLDFEKAYVQGIEDYFNNMYQITTNLTKQILDMEKQTGQKILHRNEIVKLAKHPYQWFEPHKLIKDGIQSIGRINPNFAMADNVWFIFEKGKFTEEKLKEMLAMELSKRKLPYEFWCASGYYETDKRDEAGTKLFREYALQMLEEKSKSNKNNVVKAKNLDNNFNQ